MRKHKVQAPLNLGLNRQKNMYLVTGQARSFEAAPVLVHFLLVFLAAELVPPYVPVETRTRRRS